MAMTQGRKSSRNPDWTRDELLLALDLYFRVNPASISAAHKEVVELSMVLNRIPSIDERPDPGTYRNPNGVYMKLCNFLRLDPKYKGVGLTRGGRLEENLWAEFCNDTVRLATIASAIRTAVANGQLQGVALDPDESATEGTVLLRLHKVRERSASLARKKKSQHLLDHGELRCEVCSFAFTEVYGALGLGYMEVHHLLPLAMLPTARPTKLHDLALVCANCHRMLHRDSAAHDIETLRQLVRVQRLGSLTQPVV